MSYVIGMHCVCVCQYAINMTVNDHHSSDLSDAFVVA